ncbi:MAG: hypothetical protein HY235_14125 [Acidobacteria bacterium]|nr:hypothetical protein [Acidobacteriota bacterium]
MTRTQAARGSRVVQGETYPFFYNPMWSHFGDLLAEPAGTYYYERAEYVSYGWQMFDQVLMRPELARRFGPSQIEIIRNIGDISLVKETGIPNEKVGSDHLPLWFALDF